MKRQVMKGAIAFTLATASFSALPLSTPVVEASSVQSLTGTYQVTTTALHVRSGAGTQHKSVGIIKKGQKINVTGKTANGWYRFSFNGKTAYTSGKYLKEVVATAASKPSSPSVQSGQGSYQVTASALHARTGAGTKYKSLGLLKKGQKVTITGKMANGWYRFSFKGKTAYASGAYLKQVTTAAQGKTVQLKVPYYNQYLAKAPMGCEASALLQALHYKGKAKNHHLASFLKDMPVDKSGNPHKGFGGTPYKVVAGVYQSIYAKPLAQWGKKYGNVVNISGATTAQLKAELNKGNPVVVYTTLDYKKPIYQKYDWGTGIDNAHVVTLTGYKDGYYHVTDPARGAKWIAAKSFEYGYQLTKSAVVVR